MGIRRNLEKMKNSYWLAHRLLNSNAEVEYGDIYNMPEQIGMFDVVLVYQVLIHLRDPVGALIQAGEFSSDTLLSPKAFFQMTGLCKN